MAVPIGCIQVSRFFRVEKVYDPAKDASQLESTFRGKHLIGCNQPLPEGYRGFVYEEVSGDTERMDEEYHDHHSPLGLNEDQDDYANGEDHRQCVTRRMNARFKFDELVVWDHDILPHPMENPYLRAIRWIPLATALHTPVETGKDDSKGEEVDESRKC